MTDDEVKRLYWTTTSTVELGAKGQSPTENLADVHLIGQRDTKYCRFKVLRTPFCPRGSTKYNSDFGEKPLDGVQVDKQLAGIFRPYQPQKVLTLPMTATSKYQQDYQPYAHFSPSETCKPTKQKHVKDEPLLEGTSITHEMFRGHPIIQDNRNESCAPVRRSAAVTWAPLMDSTAYGSSFERTHDRMHPVQARASKPEDQSARVMGSAIPNTYQKLMYDCHVETMEDLRSIPPVTEVIFQGVGRRPSSAGVQRQSQSRQRARPASAGPAPRLSPSQSQRPRSAAHQRTPPRRPRRPLSAGASSTPSLR